VLTDIRLCDAKVFRLDWYHIYTSYGRRRYKATNTNV